MPSIVVTPKYNPFTFDELYRPLAETTKMQMALEDQYNAMEMEAAKLDYLQKSDPDAYAIVKNYEDTLRGLAGELASNGLTPQSRQGVYDMRKMYSSDVEPINKYIAWRQAQDKARQEIMVKDPTYRWEVPLDQVKYNTWRDNPDMLFRGLSGDALAKMAQTSIQHITKRWRTDPEFKALKGKAGLEDYVQKIEEYGMSVEDMLNLSEAIANRNDLTEEEKKAINNKMAEAGALVREQVINSTDIPQWSNYEDLENPDSPLSMWIDNNIKRGLWAGIGEQKDQVLHDAGAEAERKKRETLNVNALSWGPIEKEGIVGKAGVEKLNEFYNTYRNAFNSNGTVNINSDIMHDMANSKWQYQLGHRTEIERRKPDENGLNTNTWVYGEKVGNHVEIDVGDPLVVVAYYLHNNNEEEAYKYLMEDLGNNTKIKTNDYIEVKGETKETEGRTYASNRISPVSDLHLNHKDLEKAWKFINDELPESNYDAKASTRYKWKIDPSNADEFKNNLVDSIYREIGGKQGDTFDIPIVDYSYKDKQYKNTGDTISSEDFMEATPFAIRFSKEGMIVTLVRKNGGSVDVKLPNNISRDVVNNINTYFKQAEEISKMRDEYINKYNLANKNVNYWTKAEVEDMLDFYNRFTNNINNANALIANIISTNKVNPTQYEATNKPSNMQAFNINN